VEIDEQHYAALAKVAEMASDTKFAMLTTKEKDGTLRSRPMATLQLDGEGNLWFFTSLFFPETQETQPDQQVSLSYSRSDKQDYLSVSGAAQLVHDREKMKVLWSPWLKPWFPKGLDDPNLALVKVSIMAVEYWDAPDSA
jgi:general stress protein 26